MKKTVLFLIISLIVNLNAKDLKYIFLFIGDGTSLPQIHVTNEYMKTLRMGEMIVNKFPYQAITTTHSANSQITDSAAAGTAIACGVKTNNGVLGLDVNGNKLESIAKFAKKKGKKVGIISDVTINHATPASFYGNRPSRTNYYELGLDLVNSNFDLFAGGGIGKADKIADKNIYDLAKKATYKIITDKKEFASLNKSNKKIIFSASKGAMPYYFDNDDIRLAEITKKSIELLDNPNGFFMMVEAGKIDWAGHVNDGMTLICEVLHLNEAILEAYNFALKHPNECLIIVTGDHETGGLSLGNKKTGSKVQLDLLLSQKTSIAEFYKKFNALKKANKDFTFEMALNLIKDNFGKEFVDNLTQEEKKILKSNLNNNKFCYSLIKIFNNKAGLGWTTNSHTALPVITYAYGVGAENFNSQIDNTDIIKIIKSLIK